MTDAAAVRAAAAEVHARLGGHTLGGLVNNAGMATGGPLALESLDDIRRVFEVNVFGAVAVSQAFIPLLGADRALTGEPGRIVNITSVGGILAPPFLGDYVMSKHALEAFTDSLRRELMIYGIDVIAIGPGSVLTPIWDKAEAADETIYASTDYGSSLKAFKALFIKEGRKGLPAERIGEAIHLALTTPKPKARYAVVAQQVRQLDAAHPAAQARGRPFDRQAAGLDAAFRRGLRGRVTQQSRWCAASAANRSCAGSRSYFPCRGSRRCRSRTVGLSHPPVKPPEASFAARATPLADTARSRRLGLDRR